MASEGGDDPHIHVDAKVVHGEAAARTIIAATFGLVGNLPATVATGCGIRVAYAMTSPRPESVTCLACREHAHDQHLRYAEQVERLGVMPGSVVGADDARAAAAWHRERASQFRDGNVS